MQRVTKRVVGNIMFDTAYHIGSDKQKRPTDAPLRRSVDGRIMLPGRALAGSLRTLTTRLAPRFGYTACQALQQNPSPTNIVCECPVCQLFGSINFRELPTTTSTSVASRLWVHDAFADADAAVYVRDGVGIDRQTGAARKNVKFDYELMPAGAEFQLQIDVEANVDEWLPLLNAALSEWGAGRGQLGGGVARGLGQFQLKDMQWQELEVTSAETLYDYLLSGDSKPLFKPAALAGTLPPIQPLTNWTPAIARGYVSIECTLQFKDFFLINDPLVSLITGFDHAPLVTGITAAGEKVETPLLSGSSLRGALRSHAEKIGMTLASIHWPDAETFKQHRPISNPFADENKGDRDVAWYQQKSAEFDDDAPLDALCLNDQLFGSTLNGSRFWISDAKMEKAELGDKDWKVQDFLAIDPFTGGGKDGAKFDAAPLVRPVFKAKLTLHNPRDWELGWLVLVLRDLADGMIPIGFGKAKGYGVAELSQTIWRTGFMHASDLPIEGTLLTGIYSTGSHVEAQTQAAGWLSDEWRTAAQQWVDAFNNKIKKFPEDDDNWQPFVWDPFFDTPQSELYSLTMAEVKHE